MTTKQQLSPEAQQALARIKAWRGPHGMPLEYIGWQVATELVNAGAAVEDSPGPGWGLYMHAQERQ